MSLAKILAEVARERQQQDAKWGEQNHPDGTGPDWRLFGSSAREWLTYVRAALDQTTKPGVLFADGEVRVLPPTGPMWLLILLEEVFEALVETDPAKLRAELVQVAAVAVAWTEAIDRRGPGSTSPEPGPLPWPDFNPAHRVVRCGQLSAHGPHFMDHGPDQPRNCPGTGRAAWDRWLQWAEERQEAADETRLAAGHSTEDGAAR